MSGAMELLIVCMIVGAAVIAVDVAINAWLDARKQKRLNAQWETIKRRDALLKQQDDERRSKPIEWEDVDGLDTRHLEVKHEVNKGENHG